MQNHIPAVLRIRPFLLLWLAEIFSQISMNMINFILIIVVFELTHSNTAVSGVVLAYTIPAIFLGIVAGVLVDYWSKKNVLIITNSTRLLLLILLSLWHTNSSIVLFFAFCIATANQFFIPAETPMIPLLVKKKQLFNANAFFGIGVYGSALVAYALSGPLLLSFGKSIVFLLLAFLFAIAGVLVYFIRLPDGIVDPVKIPKTSLIKGMKDAINLTYYHTHIFHSLFLLTLSQIIILILGVIGPSYAHTILRIGVEQFPIVFITPAALGMVIGAFFLIQFFHNTSKLLLANIGVLLSGIVLFLLPYVRLIASLWEQQFFIRHLPDGGHTDILSIVVVLAFLLGVANSLVFVPSNTVVQEETKDEVRGKVYGVLNAVIGIFSLLPVIIVGTLSDVFGVFHVLEGIGLVILGLFMWRILFLRKEQIEK